MSEGGNITRIVLGESNWISEGDMNIIATEGDVAFSASKKVFAHGVEEGLHVGDYDWKVEEEEDKDIAFSGWWSPDFEGIQNLKRDSRGPKAFLEEIIYFHLKVSDDVPVGTVINFKLWDYDKVLFNDSFNPDDDTFNGKQVYRKAAVRQVNGENRITIELFLDPNWSNDIVDEKGKFTDGCLDFYWVWNYNNTEWNSEKIMLSVYFSEKTLQIKPAYEGYGFPEIRTADGDIVIFSTGIGLTNDEPSEVLKSELDAINDEIEAEAFGKVRERLSTFSDELRHSVAIKQLKKGHLANNMGKIEFSRRIYTQAIFDNSGEAFTVTKAANFGYRKNGKLVTTKGISQLDYFKEVGAFNTVAKASKELLGIFDFASDLVSYAMDDKPALITTSFAPIDFIVAVLAPSILDPIKETWDNVVYEQAERAKDKGIKGINDFLLTSGSQEDRYKYDTTKIDQEILNKLLNGEFKTLKELQEKQLIKNQYQGDLPYTLFHYVQYNEDLDKDVVFIDSIFAN